MTDTGVIEIIEEQKPSAHGREYNGETKHDPVDEVEEVMQNAMENNPTLVKTDQQSIRQHTQTANADNEETGREAEIHDDDTEKIAQATKELEEQFKQSVPVNSGEERKETKSHLSKPQTGARVLAYRLLNMDAESLQEHYLTQDELLELVMQAEADRANQLAEVFNGKAYNVIRKGLGGESRRGTHVLQEQETAAGEQPTMDALAILTSFAHDEIEFTEGLKAIEYELLDLDKKAKNGDKKAKEEFGYKMIEQWKLLDKLFETQIKQGRGTDQMAEQAIAGIVQRLSSPITNGLVKVWDKLNTPNPISPALSTLHRAIRLKAENAQKPDVLSKTATSLKNYNNYFKSPSKLAEKVISLQMNLPAKI